MSFGPRSQTKVFRIFSVTSFLVRERLAFRQLLGRIAKTASGEPIQMDILKCPECWVLRESCAIYC